MIKKYSQFFLYLLQK